MSATIVPARRRFSEAMWFKKGDDEIVEASDGVPTADDLPLEERYVDDGSLTLSDSQRYSLSSGKTSRMAAVSVADVQTSRITRISDRELLREMSLPRVRIASVVVLATLGLAMSVAPLLQLLH
jgi:hypothetical protein